jgi:hypothetical protein
MGCRAIVIVVWILPSTGQNRKAATLTSEAAVLARAARLKNLNKDLLKELKHFWSTF